MRWLAAVVAAVMLCGCGTSVTVHGAYDDIWNATIAAMRAQAPRMQAEEGSGGSVQLLGKAEAYNHYDKSSGTARVVLPTGSAFTMSVGAIDARITPVGSVHPSEHRVHLRAWQKSGFLGLGPWSIGHIEREVIADLRELLRSTSP